MKKAFALLLVLSVFVTVFASTGTTGEAVEGVSEATLQLILANQYKFAFIAAGDVSSIGGTGQVTPLSEFILSTTGNALEISGQGTTLKLDKTKNVFYFFYQAYTNQSGLAIKMSAPNPLTKDDDSSQTINFTAKLETVSGKWDGENLSKTSIGPETSDSVSQAKIKASGTTEDFNYLGLCKVTISSDVDLGRKKPGNYSTNIYLTLITT